MLYIKKKYILIIFMFFLLDNIFVNAVIIDPPVIPRDFTSDGVYFHNTGSLAYFAVNQTMNFSQIVVDPDYIMFNNTGFYVTSTERINISLDYISSDILNSSLNETILFFWAETIPNLVLFEINGFNSSRYYSLYVDGNFEENLTCNVSGFISFYYNSWTTEHLFSIDVGSLGTGSSSPIITTLDATYVEETSAYLNVYINDDAGEDLDVGVHWGTTTGYGTSWDSTGFNYPFSSSNEIYQSFVINSNNIYDTKQIYSDTTYAYMSVNINPSMNITLMRWDLGTTRDLAIWYKIGTYSEIAKMYLQTSSNGITWTTRKSISGNYGSQSPNYYSWYFNNNGDRYLRWRVENIGTIPIGGTSFRIYVLYPNANYMTGDTFSHMITGLLRGRLYHFQGYCHYSGGYIYSTDKTFLTKPNPPTGLTASTVNSTEIYLTWSKGTGANNTVILRKTTGYPTDYTDGTEVYNSTGTIFLDTTLTLNEDYYYRSWSYTEWGSLIQWSDTNSSAMNYTVLDPPYNVSEDFTDLYINITWNRGNYSDEDVVVFKSTSYPSNWTDGTVLDRTNNSTGSPPLYYYSDYLSAFRFYCVFSHNLTYDVYSIPSQVPFVGGIGLNCFNESNCNQPINFDLLVTNRDGSQSYEAINCDNTHWIDISDLPYGDDTIFYISNDSYNPRIYYYDIDVNNFYNLSFYLPPLYKEGGKMNIVVRTSTSTINVSNPDNDITINTLYDINEVIYVQVFNESLYSTFYNDTEIPLYGGWVEISDNFYDFSGTQLIVNSSALDVNISMARVFYYYDFYQTIQSSYLYQLVVNDLGNQPIDDAKIIVKRYINCTNNYENISIVYTDGAGQSDVYLIPETLYQFTIIKDGFETDVSYWLPTNINFYHIFKIEIEVISHINLIPISIMVERIGTTIYTNYTDYMDGTVSVSIYYYYFNSTGTPVYVASHNYSYENEIADILEDTNTSLGYKVTIHYYSIYHSNHTISKFIDRVIEYIEGQLNEILNLLFGEHSLFIWSNIILWIAFAVMMFNVDKKDTGKGLMLIGGIMILVTMVGFADLVSSLVPALFIMVGVVVEWQNRGK